MSEQTISDSSETLEPGNAIEEGGATSGGRQFASNAFWMILSESAGKVASVAFVLLVARSLGTAAYGYFNFATSFVPLLLIFATWGLNLALIRELARQTDRLSELFSSGLVLRAGLGAAAIAVAIAISPLFVDNGQAVAVIAVVGVALFLDELSNLLGAVFKAFERMKFNAVVNLANRILSIVFAIVVLARGGGLIALCVAYLLGSVGAFVCAWLTLGRFFPPVHLRDASRTVVKQLARQGMVIGLAGGLNMAVFRIDAVMLQAIKGPVAVGLYGVAYRFIDAILFISWSLANVALPRISRAGRSRVTDRTCTATAALLLAFYLPIGVGSLFTARWVVTLLFSKRYAVAAPAVPWLTFAAVFYALAFLARMATIALGRRSAVVWVAALSLAVNIGVNAFAIPRYGYQGAAVVTFITEVVDAVVMIAVFARTLGRVPLSKVLLVPL
ncbi:MAG: hypothetical protein QOG64_2882, partial [Acidimicrobiaceae bacterium]|nr:hypothetical protein [Acidimicrobiaceae bacterium]